MLTSKADLITHPVRARIILVIMGRALTTQQIAALLPDVPRASLYRHIRELADADVLTVVEEKRIRGTLEKTYTTRQEATLLTPEDMANIGHEAYLRLITGFLSGFAHIYQAYLARREDNLPGEVLGRGIALYLTADELQTLKGQLLELIKPLEANERTPDRRRRIIGLLSVP